MEQKVQSIALLQGGFCQPLYRFQVVQVGFNCVVDFSAQNYVSVPLDNVFQTNIADTLGSLNERIKVTIHNVWDGHKCISGKKNAVLFKQNGNSVHRMSRSKDDGDLFFSYLDR